MVVRSGRWTREALFYLRFLGDSPTEAAINLLLHAFTWGGVLEAVLYSKELRTWIRGAHSSENEDD